MFWFRMGLYDKQSTGTWVITASQSDSGQVLTTNVIRMITVNIIDSTHADMYTDGGNKVANATCSVDNSNGFQVIAGEGNTTQFPADIDHYFLGLFNKNLPVYQVPLVHQVVGASFGVTVLP